jgi:hypothetical protein
VTIQFDSSCRNLMVNQEFFNNHNFTLKNMSTLGISHTLFKFKYLLPKIFKQMIKKNAYTI